MMNLLEKIEFWQWFLMIGMSLLLLYFSPWAKSNDDFYKASQKNNAQPGFWLLTSSLVISWIFAKSVTNAANLGLKYGIVGGLAYACYYLSFITAGLLLYQLRAKGQYESIHHFLSNKFGRPALVLFSILIAFRLFNEVWSNTMVIGSYFGAIGSGSYYLAILVFTLLTLAYSLKGGLKSSLLTDALQMAFFGLLLLVILGTVLPASQGASSLIRTGHWNMAGGLDLLFLALVQVFSYPFHDPVMTDRAFITDPKTMRKAFLWSAPIGFVTILLFSLIGVYAGQAGLQGQAAVEVAKAFGLLTMLFVNLIMITSASSTLDSTFASFSKLMVVDIKMADISVSLGRLVMLLLAVLGTIPLFFKPEILSATTLSGTMVIGLAPVFLFWKRRVRPSAFVLSVCTGMAFGLFYALGWYPEVLVFFEGDYGALLSVNLLGTLVCCFLYLL